jgi:hypothetical protein
MPEAEICDVSILEDATEATGGLFSVPLLMLVLLALLLLDPFINALLEVVLDMSRVVLWLDKNEESPLNISTLPTVGEVHILFNVFCWALGVAEVLLVLIIGDPSILESIEYSRFVAFDPNP